MTLSNVSVKWATTGDRVGAIALTKQRNGRMLILTRRPAETIYIGEQVTVTVLGVVGNQVRFGIEAPRSITIDRAEIHERKKRALMGNANGNVAPCMGGTEEPKQAEEPNGNV